MHFKGGRPSTIIVTVESENAACLPKNSVQRRITSLSTGKTIMTGMNCGTVSASSWPLLRQGVVVALTVTDQEAHCAIHDLRRLRVDSGPCGASTMAALRKFSWARQNVSSPLMNHDSVVVLLCTEGSRPYRQS
jgi:diaminopropionate ammonia-lyase